MEAVPQWSKHPFLEAEADGRQYDLEIRERLWTPSPALLERIHIESGIAGLSG